MDIYKNNLSAIAEFDKEILSAIKNEYLRQQFNIELIASENIVSPAVMQAMSSILTNKYAEGYSGSRYYGGCEFVDVVEDIAIERVKKLFNAEHANVQPHSGSQANMAVYFSMLDHGDTVLGMDLQHGGHLTHGSKVNISGKYFNFIPYGLNPSTELLDYNLVRDLALKHKPKLIVTGASAYSRIIDFKKFRDIADECGAMLMADIAHIAGLIIAGEHMSPFPHADFVTSTTHKTLRGPRGGLILCKQKFAANIDKAIFPGIQGGPLMHVIAAKAICFKEALQPEFKLYQQNVVKNAKSLADNLAKSGIKIVSNGTDNHLILIDLSKIGLTGKELENRLSEVNITVNKNTVPNETLSPFITSGIRIGTPAITTRGFGVNDMKIISNCIVDIINNFGQDTVKAVKDNVLELCSKYPI